MHTSVWESSHLCDHNAGGQRCVAQDVPLASNEVIVGTRGPLVHAALSGVRCVVAGCLSHHFSHTSISPLTSYRADTRMRWRVSRHPWPMKPHGLHCCPTAARDVCSVCFCGAPEHLATRNWHVQGPSSRTKPFSVNCPCWYREQVLIRPQGS